MSVTGVSDAELAGIAVAVTVVGMVVGVGLLLFSPRHALGWHLFIVSFGAWMAAAVAAMLVMWERGWFDK